MSDQRDPTKPEKPDEIDPEQQARLKRVDELVAKIQAKEQEQVKQAVPMLPCGHEQTFEHELVESLIALANLANMQGQPAMEPCVEYLQKLFAYYYINIPSYDEMVKINLANKQTKNSQEVN